MERNNKLKILSLTALGTICCNIPGLQVHAVPNDIGGKGADVYCFMRSSGNDHSVSWDASYEIVKRQKSSLFKTSPKHAAVMIVETVVQNPGKYENCGSYLGDLFGPANMTTGKEEISEEVNESSSEVKKGDRYSY